MVKKDSESKIEFALGKENYIYLTVGFVIIIIGFLLMVGGGSEDPNVLMVKNYLVSGELYLPHW